MKRIMIMAISILVLLSFCTGATQAEKAISYEAELEEQPIEALDNSFANGINAFGFKTAGLLYSADKNLAISPASIELALLMAKAGAAGNTADEMKTVLCLDGLNDNDIINACKLLMWRANTGGMETANSIWLYAGYSYSENFIRACMNDFMADAMPLIIPGAMDDINVWASEKTHGKIDRILSQELDELTRLVLCNALYFMGDWEVPFKANDTYDEDFTAPSGAVTASFMHSKREIPYHENSKYQMIILEFESNENEGNYAMAFLLPKDGKSIKDILESLEGDSFSNALASLEDKQVEIKLPKFEYSYSVLLNDTLNALGMEQAFSRYADFSGITGSTNDLYISQVLHKCYICVDELGAEAAAVTTVVIETCAYIPEDYCIEFYADKPFVFVLYSIEDNTVAFIGIVNNPTTGQV